MNILDKIVSWLTPQKQFTDAELLAGPPGDTIDHGFSTISDEEHISVLLARKRAHHLSERQVRLIDMKVAEIRKRIARHEIALEEQAQARRRKAEKAVNKTSRKAGASTLRNTDAVDDVAAYATSLHSTSYSTHKSCSSSGYDGGSSSSDSSSGGGCD